MSPRKKKVSLDGVALELIAQFPSIAGPRCWATKSKNIDLVEALARNGAHATVTQRILKEKFGESIGAQSITRHLRGECSCKRS